MRVLLLKVCDGEALRDVTLVVDERGYVVQRFKGERKDACSSDQCHDFRAGVALPGFIDLHVHLRGLELSYKEDEESGTKAAARGGFTAVIDMPNTRPVLNNESALLRKLESLYARSYVDFGVSVGIAESLEELSKMLSRIEVVGIGEVFPEEHYLVPLALRALRLLRSRKILMVHPESPEVRERCGPGLRSRCRPLELEVAAIGRLLRYSGAQSRIHITHATNVFTVGYAKAFGASVDTCPHYVYLASQDEERLGCLAKVNPPLRDRGTAVQLLRALKEVDAITSDHAPHAIDEKLSLSFGECPPGISSIEVVAPLLLNLVHRNLLTLEDVARLLALGPSRLLGLERLWGCYDVGCIASYTVVDLNREWVVDSSKFFSKAKYSPYDGLKVRGDVVATIVRGTPVYANGEIVVSKPLGVPVLSLATRGDNNHGAGR